MLPADDVAEDVAADISRTLAVVHYDSVDERVADAVQAVAVLATFGGVAVRDETVGILAPIVTLEAVNF